MHGIIMLDKTGQSDKFYTAFVGFWGFFFSYGNYRLGSEKDTKAEWRLLGKRKGMGAHKKIVKETEKSTLYKEENGTVKPVIL